MTEFYSIITKIGLNKLAEANVTGSNVRITYLAVGDGLGAYYDPKPSQKKLINETSRVNLNRIYTDPDYPNQIILEAALPETVGGFFIREVGIFDENEELFAVAKYPATFKPSSESGSGKDLYIRMTLAFSSSPNIEIFENRNNALVSYDCLDNYALKDLSNVSAESKDHQSFNNLQGGNKDQRYHLNFSEHSAAISLESILKEENRDKEVIINAQGNGLTVTPSKEIYQNEITVIGNTISITEASSIYRKSIAENTVLTIDASKANIYGKVITFEILLELTAIVNVDFTNPVKWLNEEKPDYDEIANYLIALRTFDNGNNWIASLQGKWL